MRLSEWRQRAPFKDAVSTKVVAVLEEAIGALSVDLDPECWVAWGDDPQTRYLVLIGTPAGLVQVNVRVNMPGEGPRAGAKLVRWNRVQLGEFGVEIQGGHRLVTFQVEGQVLTGADVQADRIGAFAQSIFAAVDGRPAPAASATKRRTTSRPTTKTGTRTAKPATTAAARSGTAKPPAKPAGATARLPSGPKGSAR
jgi:hypothetical protein